MTDKYDSIIDLPHHVSKTHPRMSPSERAAQFMPFAAVSGYDVSIDEAARLTVPKAELTDEETALINERLSHLSGNITLTYFVADGRKSGGHYETGTHCVKKIDPSAGRLCFTDGLEVAFDDIYSFDD